MRNKTTNKMDGKKYAYGKYAMVEMGSRLVLEIDLSGSADAVLLKDTVFVNSKEDRITIPKTTRLHIIGGQYYFKFKGRLYRMFYNNPTPWEADLADGHLTICDMALDEYYYSVEVSEVMDFFDFESYVLDLKLNWSDDIDKSDNGDVGQNS